MKSSLSLAGIFLFGFMLGASAFLNGHMLTSSSPQLIKKVFNEQQSMIIFVSKLIILKDEITCV